MKIKDGFTLRKMTGSCIVVPVGGDLVDFNSMVTLNETSVFLWEQLQSNKDINELAEAMCKEYYVDQQTAKNDIEQFVKVLQDTKLLEE